METYVRLCDPASGSGSESQPRKSNFARSCTTVTAETKVNHMPDYNWKTDEKFRPYCAVCKLESNLQARAKYGKCPSRSQGHWNIAEHVVFMVINT